MNNKIKKKKNKVSLLSYALKYKRVLFSTFFIIVVAALLGRLVNFLNAYIVDNVIGSGKFSLFIGVSLAILGMLILEAICYFIYYVVYGNIGYKISSDIRRDLYNKIIYAPLEYFENNPVSNILTKTTIYVNDLNYFFTVNFIPFLINAIKFIAVFVFMFAMNFLLGSIIFGVLVFIISIIFVINKFSAKKNAEYKKFEIQRDEIIVDSVYGLPTILANNGAQKTIQRFETMHDGLNRTWTNFARFNNLYLPLVECFWFLGIVLIYIFAFNFIGSGFEIGTVVAFLGYISQTSEPISNMTSNYQTFINIRGTLERMFDIFNIDNTANKKRKQKFADEKIDIEFFKVYCYKKFKGNVVKNLSFKIPFGSKVIIKGASGSGKTTIAFLIGRLYEPTSGKISFNGMPIQTIDNESYKKIVGIFTNNTFLFEDTMLENLKTAKPEATDEEIENALAISGLKKIVDALPNGIKTFMSGTGQYLSDGDKELLGFARLILQNPKIVILDEAYNSSDKRNKKAFFKALNKFIENKTCIYISNKDIPNFVTDMVIELENGKIVK